MAEPKVGMKFGTYKSATEALGKNLTANWKDSYRVSQEDGGTYDTTFKAASGKHEIYSDSTQIAIQRNNKKHVRVSAFIYQGRTDETRLWFEGATDNYQQGKDVKFTRIIGEKTYAVDKNGNGIVDEGEIYPCREQCAVADNDEEKYHLNTTI